MVQGEQFANSLDSFNRLIFSYLKQGNLAKCT